ncbi:tetratricopeptide repeat protein [Glycomyces sp. MUSA5-2]|uniref:tetratricopeptide repeat protein n=1 Tax=Glycomyces sp. MUSA5-2 TaxID=2053002 RepID=UPI00300AD8BA
MPRAFDNRIELVVGAPRPAPVQWPHRIGTVPPLAASRQERAADEHLMAADAPCQVLSGMGGVGKTQLAAAFATRLWERGEIDLLVWVNASGREGVIAAFAQAGVELCGAEPGRDELAANAFLNLLARPKAPRWLVVLDDLADPGALQGLWPPAHPQGRTIITTRRRDAALDAEGRTRIDIGLFSPEESLAYLRNRLGPHSKRITEAGALAERLGGLPLALAQAAAFILDQPGLTCESYLELLDDRTVALAELSPEVAPDGYHSPLNAAWSLSIEQADRSEPPGTASDLLGLAAFLDPAGIPASLFTAEPLLLHLSSHGDMRPHQVNAALARLHRLSLLDADGQLVRMHALVQRAVLDTADALDSAALAAADALVLIWPDPENNRVASTVLRANAMRLYVSARNAFLQDRLHPMLLRLVNSLGTQVSEAVVFSQILELDFGAALGDDHVNTMTARHDAARWTGERGDLATAVAETDELLKDQLRALGPEHPEVLATRAMQASWQGRSGDPVGAAAANDALLGDCLRLLDADDPFTLTVRHNLAHWRGEAGDPQGAVAATEALLDDRLRILGPDHRDTLRSRHNLAGWKGEAGDRAAAVAALRSVLDDQLRILGPDHPDTLAVRNDLARWRARTGEVDAAVKAFRKLLTDCDRLLGPGHWYRDIVAHNLDYWTERQRSGQYRGPGRGFSGGASNIGIGSY